MTGYVELLKTPLALATETPARFATSAMEAGCIPILFPFYYYVSLKEKLFYYSMLDLTCSVKSVIPGCKSSSGDSPEVGQRSFAALRMTQPPAVILSAAKDLFDRLARPFAALRVTRMISKCLMQVVTS